MKYAAMVGLLLLAGCKPAPDEFVLLIIPRNGASSYLTTDSAEECVRNWTAIRNATNEVQFGCVHMRVPK